MTDRHILQVWPATLPDGLRRLHDAVGALLEHHRITPVVDIEDIGGSDSDVDAVTTSALVVLEAAAADDPSFPNRFRSTIARLRATPDINVVFVIGDGYLGTDLDDLNTAMAGAAAVSAVRSLALTRKRPGRSNVVAVPDALLGRTGSQRGPLGQPTEVEDVAHAVAYLIGDTGNYVSGQTLFVNGGRHLFSSQTA